ncbi:MAG: UDP-glucose/GDP-mannose dehydrogenase family protein [Candidatus Sulfobium sp.]
MHIGIIGTGYVGLVTGACFAEFGIFVTCVDKDAGKVRALRTGQIQFYEPGLEDLVKRNIKNGNLKFSTRVRDAVDSSLVIFIAVGTPPRGDGSADMRHIDEVVDEIARNISGYKVIVMKSTVPIGTCSRVRKIISRKLKEKVDFDIVSNPEFLREGAAIEDFMRPNRVVIGTGSQQATAIMKDLYSPLYLIETPIVTTNIETAELIKYASNSFLAVKISFINEMSKLCEKVGADVQMVAKGMGLDRRIGPKFLHSGPGYGGSCFPKDTRALLAIADGSGVELGIVRAAVGANEEQKRLMIEKIRRETLLKEGAAVKAFDPVAVADAKKLLDKKVQYAVDAYDCVKGADAVVIVTEWNEFRNLEMARIRKSMKTPYFFDLRNIYESEKMKKLGFNYFSVGREKTGD